MYAANWDPTTIYVFSNKIFFFFFQKQEHEKQASKKILENLTICLCMKISKDKHNYLERLSDENYELYWSNNIFPSV